MRLILASSSPRRRDLLQQAGYNFDIIAPDVDETQLPGEAPIDYVRRLSRMKADAVAAQVEAPAAVIAADTIVLAADTIGIDHAGEILGKPQDADEARSMLRRLRGQAHLVCTAFTVCSIGEPAFSQTETVETVVYMRGYSDAEIDAYIASGDPFDKAGSYAIQNEQFAPVMRIEGDYNNVVGLPLAAVESVLAAVGIGKNSGR